MPNTPETKRKRKTIVPVMKKFINIKSPVTNKVNTEKGLTLHKEHPLEED